MTLKSMLKKVFAPRKTRKAAVKVALPAPALPPVKSPEEEKADKIRAFLKALEDFAYAPNVEGEDLEEYQRMVDAAKALGLDVENFDGNQNSALIAAILGYHGLRHDDFNKDFALDDIRDAFDSIRIGNYTFYDDVFTLEALGNTLCELLIESGGWKSNHNWLLEYVDWNQLAADTKNDEGGALTDWGYFQYGSLEYC